MRANNILALVIFIIIEYSKEITKIKSGEYSDHGNRAACHIIITAELIPVSTDGNIKCAMIYEIYTSHQFLRF